jgi:hypothetical protein
MNVFAAGAMSAEVVMQPGGIARIHAQGQLCLDTLPVLREVGLRAANEAGALVVVVDMTEAKFKLQPTDDLPIYPGGLPPNARRLPVALVVPPKVVPAFDRYSLANIQAGAIRNVATDVFSAVDWAVATSRARQLVQAERNFAEALIFGRGSEIAELRERAFALRRLLDLR